MLLKEDLWKTLDIDYHPPKVERLYTSKNESRLSLHVLHPCTREEALLHPHPWPSAIKILKGTYEMGIGYGPGLEPPPISCTIELGPGTYYEMMDINGWHYVRPLEPVYTLMLTGPKWDREEIKSDFPLKPLSSARKFELLQEFLHLLV